MKAPFPVPLAVSLAVVACIAAVAAHAEDPLSSDQRDNILKQLEVIQEVIDGKRVSTRTSAVQSFTNASASDEAAYDFYLQCHKLLKFDKRDAKFAEYRDWRDRNEDKIRTKSNLAAMRIQLQYLVLTMRAAEGVDREAIVPELESFVANIVANADILDGDGMKTLRTPVTRTIFAEAYDLNRSLKVDEWHLAPGEYASVYEESVFPFIRENAPERLSDTWDRRIGLEVRYTELTQEGNDIAWEKFETERLPRLHWSKANDIFRYVSQKEGAAAMIRLVQTREDHPDVAKWVASFRSLLAPPPELGDPESAVPASDVSENERPAYEMPTFVRPTSQAPASAPAPTNSGGPAPGSPPTVTVGAGVSSTQTPESLGFEPKKGSPKSEPEPKAETPAPESGQ